MLINPSVKSFWKRYGLVSRPRGATVLVRLLSAGNVQTVVLPPGEHVFGCDHNCDYVLPGLEADSAFTAKVSKDYKIELCDARGALASDFASRLSTQRDGTIFIELGATSLVFRSGGLPFEGYSRICSALVLTCGLVGLTVAAGSAALGWQGPSSKADRSIVENQVKTPGVVASSGVTPAAAFAAIANDQLARIGSSLRAHSETDLTVRVSGVGSAAEASAAEDLLLARSRRAGVSLEFEHKRPLIAEKPPEIKALPALPTLQVVSVTESPTSSVIVKGGTKLRIGSVIADGWTVDAITLNKVQLRRGSERHAVEF